jgi:hypothetical protein
MNRVVPRTEKYYYLSRQLVLRQSDKNLRFQSSFKPLTFFHEKEAVSKLICDSLF